MGEGGSGNISLEAAILLELGVVSSSSCSLVSVCLGSRQGWLVVRCWGLAGFVFGMEYIFNPSTGRSHLASSLGIEMGPCVHCWRYGWIDGREAVCTFLLLFSLLFSLPGILVWMGAQGGALYKLLCIYRYPVSPDSADFPSLPVCGSIPTTCVNNCLQRVRWGI